MKEFLTNIDQEDLLPSLEMEMITLDILKEMTHDDLKSVGVSRFGQRHKIIKEFGKRNLHNVVENISQEKSRVEFPCDVCDENFLDYQTLNVHMNIHLPLHQSHRLSHYDGGNLFHSERYVISMVNGEDEDEVIQAESTRLPIHNETIRERTSETIQEGTSELIREETVETIREETLNCTNCNFASVFLHVNIALARGGAHLPIAHALRLLSIQELKLRKNNFLK